ncbi:hypothetical protein GCG54_00011278 [Colletotrichum gloeosporioides]|uniref:Uncharacterized protein n=1 Tax=Colletotrichum gloeosporioides TaxID=474922 RepID=A0A8H4CSP2_COLGL|nr:uncharacterized protein GCG54_00011278 [Colletotrichum gloeosporioides]KAF3809082.1 hypothetical protein GCG54_00011278 [Colletotrichum gloeosporioides]
MTEQFSAATESSAIDAALDHQEQAPFFCLPWEIRIVIYELAFPRINSPQLIYTDVGGIPSFNDISNIPSGSPPQLKRIACNGVFEDKGIEIRAQRFAARFEAERVDDRSGFCQSVLDLIRRPHDESIYPLPLLLACRRMYEDVAPHCEQSIAIQDFFSLELFLTRISRGVLANGLSSRLNKVSLDVKLSSDGAFKPSSRKKILASWSGACQRLTSLGSIKHFHVRLEIPLSQQRSVPGHIHLHMIKQLSPIAAAIPKIEVELMLTSTVHPKSERIWVYRPGPTRQHRGYEVPGWTAEISVWGSFPRLDDIPSPLKEL